MEVNVISKGKSLRKLEKNGKTYVQAIEGDEYQIEITSDSGLRTLCVCTVDGLDVITGKAGDYKAAGGYVFKRHLLIEGWRKSDSQVAAFNFSTVEDSYSKKCKEGDSRNCGVIGVALYQEKVKAELYSGEVKTLSMAERKRGCGGQSMLRASSMGTGWGQNKDSVVQDTTFEKSEGEPDIAVIHYRSFGELIKLGFTELEIVGEEGPNPFPASDSKKYCKPPTTN